MINPEDNQDTAFIHRSTEQTPTRNIGHFLIGRPLQTADAPHQTIGKGVGLAVFASDALSSTAYATQEILVILGAAGTMAGKMIAGRIHQATLRRVFGVFLIIMAAYLLFNQVQKLSA